MRSSGGNCAVSRAAGSVPRRAPRARGDRRRPPAPAYGPRRPSPHAPRRTARATGHPLVAGGRSFDAGQQLHGRAPAAARRRGNEANPRDRGAPPVRLEESRQERHEPATSTLGRPQFSVEKAYSVNAGTPSSRAARTILPDRLGAGRCPSYRARPRGVRPAPVAVHDDGRRDVAAGHAGAPTCATGTRWRCGDGPPRRSGPPAARTRRPRDTPRRASPAVVPEDHQGRSGGDRHPDGHEKRAAPASPADAAKKSR